MYQTRRKLAILKDAANIVSPKYDDNFCEILQVVHPKKPANLCKINLRTKNSCKNQANTGLTVCADKENVTGVDQAKLLQKRKNKQSIVCQENAPINKTKNCTKSKQKVQNSTKLNQISVDKENVANNFKSYNVENSGPKCLIYNKCLKTQSKMPTKRSKRAVVDVYDISADDDLKKEEHDLAKSKKLKVQLKKTIKKCSTKNGKKNVGKSIKKAATVPVMHCANIETEIHQLISPLLSEEPTKEPRPSTSEKHFNTQLQLTSPLTSKEPSNLNIQHQLASPFMSKEPTNLNIPYQLASPLTSEEPINLNILQNNHLKDISAAKINSHCSTSFNMNTLKKSKQTETSKSISNAARRKHSDKNKENILMKNNKLLLKEPPVVAGNEIVRNKDPGKRIVREATPVRELDSSIPALDEDSSCLPGVMPQTSTPQNGDHPCPTFDLEHEFTFAARMSEIPISPLEVAPKNKPHQKPNKKNQNANRPEKDTQVSGIPDILTPPPESVRQKRSCQEQCKTDFDADSYFRSLLEEGGVLPDDEDESEYVTAVNNYSLLLFGSPEKVEEEEISSKHQGVELHSDIDESPIKKLNKNKKQTGQAAAHCKKTDFVQKKTATEKKLEAEEEAFYKSFNDHLSDLDNYELCIE